MSRGRIKALYFGYGFREESISLFEKIGRAALRRLPPAGWVFERIRWVIST
jgi:hypothetical protein